MKRIICFHLLNDYSGSPIVLKNIVEQLASTGYSFKIITSKGGVLDSIQNKNVSFLHYNYSFSRHKGLTFLKYLGVQLFSFLYALRYAFQKNTIFYINTLLPVGPALSGWLTGKKVLYHYHENARNKGRAYIILSWFMQRFASAIICVSSQQAQTLKRNQGKHIVPNAISHQMACRLIPHAKQAFLNKTILMAASLKKYKGVEEYATLSSMLPDYHFVLVLSNSQEEIDNFIHVNRTAIPSNLTIYPCQKDIVPFYNEASLVVNLSNKLLVKETFGMTVLEAMTCSLPTIVPTEGGIAELVKEGITGYKIDVQDLNKMADTIHNIFSDEKLYLNLAQNAYNYSKNFSMECAIRKIKDVIEQ